MFVPKISENGTGRVLAVVLAIHSFGRVTFTVEQEDLFLYSRIVPSLLSLTAELGLF